MAKTSNSVHYHMDTHITVWFNIEWSFTVGCIINNSMQTKASSEFLVFF